MLSILLTKREEEVLGLVAQGLRNREIALQLYLTEETIEQYLKCLYKKLGVTNRVGATAWFLRWER